MNKYWLCRITMSLFFTIWMSRKCKYIYLYSSTCQGLKQFTLYRIDVSSDIMLPLPFFSIWGLAVGLKRWTWAVISGSDPLWMDWGGWLVSTTTNFTYKSTSCTDKCQPNYSRCLHGAYILLSIYTWMCIESFSTSLCLSLSPLKSC